MEERKECQNRKGDGPAGSHGGQIECRAHAEARSRICCAGRDETLVVDREPSHHRDQSCATQIAQFKMKITWASWLCHVSGGAQPSEKG
jgi:hypothetical protein